MPTDLLLALIGFAIATSFTPGPNTLMLLASGVAYGFRRTLPHMAGIGFGFAFLLAVVGLGLAEGFRNAPAAQRALAIASALYMVWLAWRIATAPPPGEPGAEGRGRPMSFLEAALFQWINPKAWAIALSGAAIYIVPERAALSVAIMAGVFWLVNVPCAAAWTGFGVALRRVLHAPRRARIFNIAMATLLVASLWPILVRM
jgi:threonine/homoserine/homoserine lactone efflux protein